SLAIAYVDLHEPKLKEAVTDHDRYWILYYLCPAALSAGEIDKAKSFANTLLEIAPRLERRPGFGPGMNGAATHIANIVLGRIALDEGKVAKAKEHLLAAGSIEKGDPPLVSFGPDMLLAKRLIEKDERKVAVEYLDLCALFWTYKQNRVAEWRKTIDMGGMPDFGANLNYITGTWRFAK